MNNVDPRQVSKIMKSALGNPFEQKELSGEPRESTLGTSGLTPEEREVVSAIQDGLTDPEAISLNTRLTLVEVKRTVEALKQKGKMVELGSSQPNLLNLGSQPSSSTPSNSVSTALRNNSGISNKGSSLFVPKSSQGKLRIF